MEISEIIYSVVCLMLLVYFFWYACRGEALPENERNRPGYFPPPPPPPQPEWVKFNLNDEIRVKLTERGFEELAEDWNERAAFLDEFEKRNADYYKEMADAEGYFTMRAHEFITLFGPIIYVGSDFVNANILIASKNIEPYAKQ